MSGGAFLPNWNCRALSVLKLFKCYSPEFELVYDTKATLKSQREEEAELGDDLPDVIIGGQIDLGQIAIEQLALVMEDYPRKEGEVFHWESEFDEEDDKAQNPFKNFGKT